MNKFDNFMEKAWHVLGYSCISFLATILCLLIGFAFFSNKETIDYRINSSYSGQTIVYRIIETRNYASSNEIILPDSCNINDALKIKAELERQLKNSK